MLIFTHIIMKKLLLIGAIFLLSKAYSQEFILPDNLVDDFIQSRPANVGLNMTITTKLDNDNFYEIELKYYNKKESFKLRPLTYPVFETKFKNAIFNVINGAQVAGNTLSAQLPSSSIVKEKVPLIFSRIVTFHNTEEERPEVATIYLKNEKIPLFTTDDEFTDKVVEFLTEASVEISFYGGFIEKIQVKGKLEGSKTSIVLNNKYSIGISSTKNITQISDNKIFSNEKFSKEIISNIFKTTKERYESAADEKEITPAILYKETEIQYAKQNKSSLYTYVDAIIKYVKKVDVNANDVSPMPQLILLDINQPESKLYKEESTKLFEAVVYSDLLGLFEDQNSNGILQTEIKKTFNINTKRFDSPRSRWFFWFPLIYFSEGCGFFQNFEAKFKYSKIESDDKFIIPSTINLQQADNSVVSSEPFYTNLDLYQRMNYSVGGNINVLTFENQNAKLNMYFQVGGFFGRTGLKENEEDTDGFFVNHLEIPFEYKFHLLPEKRVSFTYSNKLSYFKILDSDINLKSVRNGELRGKNEWLHSFNINLNVNVSSTGKLFARYKLIHDFKNINNNFSQLQFGYSFYLLKNNGKIKDNIR